jgi:UDPglucose--hexose-1-phosphate uridylyltransferase
MTPGLFFHVPTFRVEPLPRPELRRDPIADRWVIVSTDRLGRPFEEVESFAPQSPATCPFCAGNEHMTPEPNYVDPPTGDWRVRIVPNTFPAVRGDGIFEPTTDGLNVVAPASGIHDVVIACGQHERNIARLPTNHVTAILRAFRERIRAIAQQHPDYYTTVFNNYKAAAGASMEHAHCHVLALPFVPETVRSELASAQNYHTKHDRCIFCDLISQERREMVRIVFESARFVALTPFASRFPCEIWILPRDHAGRFDQISDDDLVDLGSIFRLMLCKLDVGLADPPYNFLLHSAPIDISSSRHYHWHIEILPRLTGTAGFEWGFGMNINPVPPEQSAAYLRAIEPS